MHLSAIPIQWGIFGTGKIARVFAQDFAHVDMQTMDRIREQFDRRDLPPFGPS